MEVLKRIVNFYLDSSIHVAFAVFALTWVTLLQFDLDYDKNVLYFVFFATITGYNFVKYFGVAKFHHRSLAFWLKAIQVFSFIAFIANVHFQLPVFSNFLISVFSFPFPMSFSEFVLSDFLLLSFQFSVSNFQFSTFCFQFFKFSVFCIQFFFQFVLLFYQLSDFRFQPSVFS